MGSSFGKTSSEVGQTGLNAADQSRNQAEAGRVTGTILGSKDSNGDGAASSNKVEQPGERQSDATKDETEQPSLLQPKAVQPSVFRLPHNPLSNTSYKQNYIKSRVEGNRLDYLQANPTKTFKTLHQDRLSYAPMQNPEAMLQYNDRNMNSDLHVAQADQSRLQGQGARRSTNNFITNNTYIKNQRRVTYKKKEDQSYYYMQQLKQNMHRLEGEPSRRKPKSNYRSQNAKTRQTAQSKQRTLQ